jgi:protein gp37
MAKDSKIEWTHHTFNPWMGCTKVSPGCVNCYAEKDRLRRGQKLWGPNAPRQRTSAAYWKQPIAWNAAAAELGERHRVFCASLADVCEDRDDLLAPRADLMRLIEATPQLDWLLLTKRPENFVRFFGNRWSAGWPPNVWAMASVTTQAEADRNVPILLTVPAAVRGLSMEPLLERVELRPEWLELELQAFGGGGAVKCFPRIDWVIVGGESGPEARPMHPEWATSLRDQCAAFDVPFLFKQWGEWKPMSATEDNESDGWYKYPKRQFGGEVYEDREVTGRCIYKTTVLQLDGSQRDECPVGAMLMFKVGKKVSGRNLDGRLHDGYPKSASEEIRA